MVISRKRGDVLYVVFVLAVALGLALLTFSYTTDKEIIKDARQSTAAAYYLVHTGTIGAGDTEDPDPPPQMRREPLPIVALAAFLLLHPAFSEPYKLKELTSGRLTETVKGINAVYRFLAGILIFLLCRELFPGRLLAATVGALCIVASEFLFLSQSAVVDRLYTELPAVTLLLLSSWLSVRFSHSKTKMRALAAGSALGALALTKVAFFHIGICFIVILLTMDAVNRLRSEPAERSWRSLLAPYAVMALGMAALVGPWIVRNAVEFGKPQINTGGELVLAIRMLLTEQPLLGNVYWYSPGPIKKLIGPLAGYTPADLVPGGKLEDLVTAKTRKAETLKQRIKAEGYHGDRDAWMMRAAIKYVKDHPLRYVASIGVFAYKGMGFMKRGGVAFNVLAMLCFLGVFFGAFFTANQTLFAAFGLPGGLYIFTSMFTHALTRFNAPITPFAVISMAWLVYATAVAGYARSPRFRNFVDRTYASIVVKASSNEAVAKNSGLSEAKTIR